MRKKLSVVLQAFLIMLAMQLNLNPMPVREEYKSGLHYLFAQVTMLLGDYSWNSMLLLVLAVIFILYAETYCADSVMGKKISWRVLAVFFAGALLVGRGFRDAGSLRFYFNGLFPVIRFLVMLSGYTIAIFTMMKLFFKGLELADGVELKGHFFHTFLERKSFRNVFLLLLVCWAPAILMSYPGNLCYDCLGQISQGLGMSAYSTHHPLLHTLIVTVCLKFGKLIGGGYGFGLFLYVCLQAICLAAALAASMARLYKREANRLMRFLILGIYVFAPMYSNMVSTAVKDVLFMAAVIWYFLLLEEMVTEGFKGRHLQYYVNLVLVEALVGLLRNNGIYMVALTGICLAVTFWKQYRKKVFLRALMALCILPLLFCKGANAGLAAVTDAQSGSVAEMLSIPFQQTARYLQLYRHELTGAEKTAIENVLQDVELVAANYNPDISDPVKALYCGKGMGDLGAYFKVWLGGLSKHPGVYFDAFFAHVYGWFDPGALNAVRYEAESELFPHPGIFNTTYKLMFFVYRLAEHIPFLAILDNVGIYTWLLFMISGICIQQKERRGVLLIPLYVSLLICMASPCFYLHPRYAFPIMFSIPYLYGIFSARQTEALQPSEQAKTEKKSEKRNKKEAAK